MMRNSPRKRAGATGCTNPVEFTNFNQLARAHIGALRHLAAEQHAIRNAALLKKPDLIEKLKQHFLHQHGVDLDNESDDACHSTEQGSVTGGSPISQTIDKLRNRIQEQKTIQEESDAAKHNEMITSRGEDRLIQLAEQALNHAAANSPMSISLGASSSTATEDTRSSTQEASYQKTEVVTVIEPNVELPQQIVSEEIVQDEVAVYTKYITPDNKRTANHGDEENYGDANESENLQGGPTCQIMEKIPKREPHHVQVQSVCHAYVVAKSVKELKELGREMLRIHAENHGIEHANRLRMSELLKEMIEHYNIVHQAGLELSKLDMLKLNMLKLRKVRIEVREKTPPPDFSKMIPKNVVPIEEQVHHVYEKRPDICTVDIIVNNLKDMLALGTSILRPEASKHRVANSSRKQKLQVVEELWDHYLKFHLRDSHNTGDVVEEDYDSEVGFVEREQDQTDFIVVREEDIVQGEEIQAVAEEVTQ